MVPPFLFPFFYRSPPALSLKNSAFLFSARFPVSLIPSRDVLYLDGVVW